MMSGTVTGIVSAQNLVWPAIEFHFTIKTVKKTPKPFVFRLPAFFGDFFLLFPELCWEKSMLGLSSGRIEDVGTDETPCRRRLNPIKIINNCKKNQFKSINTYISL